MMWKEQVIACNTLFNLMVLQLQTCVVHEAIRHDDVCLSEAQLNLFMIFYWTEALEEEPANEIDLSSFSGNLRRDDRDNARDCWKISDGNNFRVRSKHFCYDKSKVFILLFLLYFLNKIYHWWVFSYSFVVNFEGSCWKTYAGSCCCRLV